MVMRVVSITSVSICQVSKLDLVKTLLFCNTACFSICQKWKVIFKFDQDIQRDICQTRSPFKAFSRVEYVVRENQNRTAKWVRHNRVKIFLRADLFRFSCTDVFTRYKNWNNATSKYFQPHCEMTAGQGDATLFSNLSVVF